MVFQACCVAAISSEESKTICSRSAKNEFWNVCSGWWCCSTWDLLLVCLRLPRHLRRHNTCHITWGSLTPLITYDIISHGLITPHKPLTFFWSCVPRLIIIGHLSLIWDHHPLGLHLSTSLLTAWPLVTIMGVVTICLTCWLIFVAETTQEEPGQVNKRYFHSSYIDCQARLPISLLSSMFGPRSLKKSMKLYRSLIL